MQTGCNSNTDHEFDYLKQTPPKPPQWVKSKIHYFMLTWTPVMQVFLKAYLNSRIIGSKDPEEERLYFPGQNVCHKDTYWYIQHVLKQVEASSGSPLLY